MPTPEDPCLFETSLCCAPERERIRKTNELAGTDRTITGLWHQAGEFVSMKDEISAMRQQLSRIAAIQAAVQESMNRGFSLVEKGLADVMVVAATSTPEIKPAVRSLDDSPRIQAYPSTASPPSPLKEASQKLSRLSRSLSISASHGDTRTGRALTKSSFGGLNANDEDDADLLMAVFELDEFVQEEKAANQQRKRNIGRYMWEFLRAMGKEEWEMFMDCCMGMLICANAIFIGLSMDMEREGELGWLVMNAFFTLCFLAELVVKSCMHGMVFHFLGPQCFMNCLDAALICADAMQLGLAVVGAEIKGVPSASLFRVIRLVKLARILRVVEHPACTDLLCMLQGMLGGLNTLGWAMFLFLIAVYCTALVAREFLGRREVDGVHDMFDSVPRAMLTTFRCSFGDCSTPSGTPVFEHVTEEYGGLLTFSYCVVTFTITIGLFNVISAIFVERTMASAATMESKKKAGRLQDDVLWSTSVATLVRRLMFLSPDHEVPDRLADAMGDILTLDVPATVVDELAEDAEAVAALERLDIDREDHPLLSDILDPDKSGTIRVVELIDGIKRLRGEPRRADIITVDLMVRSLQRDLALIKKATCDEDALLKRLSLRAHE